MSVAVETPVEELRETLPAVADSPATEGPRRLARMAARLRRTELTSREQPCNFRA